jgi:glucose/mannose transport system permease protein
MRPKPSARARLETILPAIVLSPAFVLAILFFCGLSIWIGALSLTPSRGRIQWQWAGLDQYARLFADEAWIASLVNLAVFLPVAIGLPLALGAFLAILLDQRIRAEGILRTLYLYPLALSWIVSGTLWLWMLRPDIGIESLLKRAGFANASFDWVVNPDYSPACAASTTASSRRRGSMARACRASTGASSCRRCGPRSSARC